MTRERRTTHPPQRNTRRTIYVAHKAGESPSSAFLKPTPEESPAVDNADFVSYVSHTPRIVHGFGGQTHARAVADGLDLGNLNLALRCEAGTFTSVSPRVKILRRTCTWAVVVK